MAKAPQIPEVFISYKIGEPRSEKLRDALTELLEKQPYNLHVITDVKYLQVLDDLKAFMTSLARAKYVIVILTETYLKSENCMFELATMANEGQLGARVFPIVFDEVTIKDTKTRLVYARHWSNALKELQDQVAEIPAQQRANSTKADLQKLERIVLGCQDALSAIANMRYMGLQSGEALDAGRIAEYIKGWTKEREAADGDTFITNIFESGDDSTYAGSRVMQRARRTGGKVFFKGTVWMVLFHLACIFFVGAFLLKSPPSSLEELGSNLAEAKSFFIVGIPGEIVLLLTIWKFGEWGGKMIGVKKRHYLWVGPATVLLPTVFAGIATTLIHVLNLRENEGFNFEALILTVLSYSGPAMLMGILAGRVVKNKLNAIE